tara:strand:- start:3594 stop:5120 length:1527 start_codon:yes stop_codon:yes gene_type:complete
MSLSLNGSGGIFGLDQGLNVTGVGTFQTLNVTGNLTVDGILTYEDVTNVESIGVITARSGIHALGDGNLVGIGTSSPESRLHIYGTHNSHIRMTNTSSDALDLIADANKSGQDSNIFNIKSRWNGTDVARISFKTGSDTTDKDDADITFHTKSSGSSIAERLRIDSDGQATFDKGAVGGSNQVIARFQAESSRRLDIVWHDSGSLMGFDTPSNHSYIFKTNGTERLRVTSGGDVGINESSPDNKLHITTNSSTAYSDSTNNNSNLTNALLKLENTNGTDDTGVNNYVGIQFSVASGASSTAQLQYVRTGNNSGSFELKARNASSTMPNLVSIGSSGAVTLPAQERFRARKQTTQAGTDNNSLWVTFAGSNGTVDYDTHSGFSESNDWYEIQNDGYFMIYASVLITSSTSNSLRDYQMAITDSSGGTNTALAAFTARASTASDDDTHSMQATFLGNLTAGARIRLRAFGNADTGNYTILDDINDGIGGAGLDVGGLGDKATHFTVVKLG